MHYSAHCMYYLIPNRGLNRIFLVAQAVKNLPAMQEIHVQSLGQEDHLEVFTL